MKNTWSVTESDWQGIDHSLDANSSNLLENNVITENFIKRPIEQTDNLYDTFDIFKYHNATYQDGIVRAKCSDLEGLIDVTLDDGQYIVSFIAKCEGNHVSTHVGGFQIQFVYSDSTIVTAMDSVLYCDQNSFVSSPLFGISNLSKTLTGIKFHTSSGGQNYIDIKEFQVRKGNVKLDYIPSKSSIDYNARKYIDLMGASVTADLTQKLTKEINGIIKGITYISAYDEKKLNIDIANSQCIIGDTAGSTGGYIAFADGNYIAFKQGTTAFTKSGFGIYFLYFFSDDQLFYVKKYTEMSSLDYAKVKILGLITINNSGDLVYDGICFDHLINGQRSTTYFRNPLEGKKLSILGDSISSYSGYIPSGNAAFYPYKGNDVNDVRYTWWKRLLDYTGMILDTNNSWSASRVATPPAGRTEKAFTNSDRYTNLGNPDIIIVFGGINDEFAQANPTEVGEYNFTYTNPSTLDLTKLKQAFQFLCEKLQNLYPNAKIFLCTQTFRGNHGVFQQYDNNGIAQYQLHDIVRDVSKFYGVGLIDLAKCGINSQNFSNYLGDSIHPNREGMRLIYEKVLGTLNQYYDGQVAYNAKYF